MARIKNLSGAPKTQIERGGSGAHLFRDRRLAGEPLVEVGILHVNDILELLQCKTMSQLRMRSLPTEPKK